MAKNDSTATAKSSKTAKCRCFDWCHWPQLFGQRFFPAIHQPAVYVSIHRVSNILQWILSKGCKLLSVHPYCWLAKHLWQTLEALSSRPAHVALKAYTCLDRASRQLGFVSRVGRISAVTLCRCINMDGGLISSACASYQSLDYVSTSSVNLVVHL